MYKKELVNKFIKDLIELRERNEKLMVVIKEDFEHTDIIIVYSLNYYKHQTTFHLNDNKSDFISNRIIFDFDNSNSWCLYVEEEYEEIKEMINKFETEYLYY